MRIGINARFLIKDQLEGIGWYSYHVLRNMVLNHPEHEYYFFFDRKPDPSFLFNSSVKPVVLFPQARHPFLWYWWFECSIPAAIKKYKIDLFFSPDGYASLAIGIPQFIVIHDLAYFHYPKQVPYLVRKYYQRYVPKHLLKATHLFAVSEATKTDLIRQFPFTKNKISIAYNGVRTEFKPLPEIEINNVKKEFAGGKNYFLFVGAIHPRKNIANLISAFDLFKKSSSNEIALLIVGRKAWLTQETETALHNAQFKNDIQFYPYVDTQTLAKITAAAFYAINPSLLEGFGVPVLEALYCDVPVMVSDRFSLPEIAGPGAITFNPEDINEIAHAMLRSTTELNRNDRIVMGRQHRTRFDWEHTSEVIYSKMMPSK